MWLKSSSASVLAGCTGLDTFTTYLSWDFGVITMKGVWLQITCRLHM